MSSNPDQIQVVSHVARDLLQSAALFKTDKLVVWEYVANGLQYVDAGTKPLVIVRLDSKNKKITVTDNGSGMDWKGLQNFFIMHGENVDRLKGRPGRGRFGTGKSAAFGIAQVLRVSTTKNEKRSIVELDRKEIEALKSGEPIPVREIECEIDCNKPDGTIIEIKGVLLKSLDQKGVIEYIERHLAKWQRDGATVFVNSHECEYREPSVSAEYTFKPGLQEELLGDVALFVKVSKGPVDEDFRGISIYSNGVWYETTLAGEENRDMSQFIFGEIDVPSIDSDTSPIPPVDMSRSMKLNPSNELVQAVYSFIGRSVRQVRLQLVEEEKKRKASQETKRLMKEANEIARVINEDFESFRQRIAKALAKRMGSTDDIQQINKLLDGEDLIPGGENPAIEISSTGNPGADGDSAKGGGSPRMLEPLLESDEDGNKKGAPAQPHEAKRRKGGFAVEFANLGEDQYRAQYTKDERTIYINLDHPQVIAAKGAGVDETAFRRLAYEIAFCEYAIALASELAARDEYIDPTDPIFDIRDTINRIAVKAAALYA
jgi:hypothetical protein